MNLLTFLHICFGNKLAGRDCSFANSYWAKGMDEKLRLQFDRLNNEYFAGGLKVSGVWNRETRIVKFAKPLSEQQSTRVLLYEMCHMGRRKDGVAIAAERDRIIALGAPITRKAFDDLARAAIRERLLRQGIGPA